MALYVDCNEPYGIHADYYREATQEEIMKELKKMNMVAVPLDQLKISYFEGGGEWLSFPKEVIRTSKKST